MYRLQQPGQIIFAVGIIALGILQFIIGDYIIGRPPSASWIASVSGKLAWSYISAALLIVGGIAILFREKARSAALIIGTMILICSFVLRHLVEMSDWGNAFKSLALAGGAFIIAASFQKEEGEDTHHFFTNHNLVQAGSIFLALFLVICGILHFKFHEFVRNFIPAYIPVRLFFTYFTAVALIAGGCGLVFKRTRKWAAVLSGFMILLWFVLLHLPRAFAAPHDNAEWMGVCESFIFSGIFFVLAALTSKEVKSDFVFSS